MKKNIFSKTQSNEYKDESAYSHNNKNERSEDRDYEDYSALSQRQDESFI